MSNRDRADQRPPGDGVDRPTGGSRWSARPDRRGGRSSGGGGFDEWDLDPSDVERYLEDRASSTAPPPGRTGTPPQRDGRDAGRRWSGPRERPRGAAPQAPPPDRPYDAPAPSSPRRAEDPLDPRTWDAAGDGWAEPAPPRRVGGRPAQVDGGRRRAGSSGGRARSGVGRVRRPPPRFRLPAAIAGAALLTDRIALGLGGAVALGLVLLWVTVGTQLGGLEDPIALRFDADGLPRRWGPPEALWQLPLMATMVALINAVLGWPLARFDRFAARFLLAVAGLVQVLVWVAVLHFVF